VAKASQADLEQSILRRKAEKEGRKRKVSSNGHVPGLALPSCAVELPMTLSAYFNENGFCLLQGDCREILAQFPDNHFDMVFADPPYMLSNDGFTVHAGKRASVNKGKWDKSRGLEEDFKFHMEWIAACRRVLKPEGTLWISGTYHSIYACGYALQLHSFKLLNDIAWYKPNASPNLSCRFFTASHETLLWARKSAKAKHVFNYKEMREGEWGKDFLKKPGKQMRSIWAINTPPPEEKTFGKHPTQKPIELLRRIVLASTKPGALILDPFSGSASTGLAAVANGRSFVGVEMERKYLELAVKRFKKMDSENSSSQLSLLQVRK
jgi:site-specific DNA-methyltransferase (adenine-specific)